MTRRLLAWTVIWTIALCAPAWSQRRAFETLHHFGSGEVNSANGLVRGAAAGVFYGTSYGGGVDSALCSTFGCGTVFRFSVGDGLLVLNNFTPGSADGSNPRTGLVPDGQGGFYGTTGNGGANGGGTIFRLSSEVLTTQHAMKQGAEYVPVALSRAANGDLLLATAGSEPADFGAVLRYATASGSMTTLRTYPGGDPKVGILPVGLIEGADGSLYGVVGQGGTTTDFGSVFRLAADATYTTLHSFAGDDGGISVAGVIQASDGALYGTTTAGGNLSRCRDAFLSGCGVIYRISTDGTFTVVHEFAGGLGGAAPYSALLEASDGHFYGTTYSGGAFPTCPGVGIPRLGCGTIFRLTRTGTLSVIHRFNGQDGANPRGALVEGADGYLYGTTDRGGNSLSGTIFRIRK